MKRWLILIFLVLFLVAPAYAVLYPMAPAQGQRGPRGYNGSGGSGNGTISVGVNYTFTGAAGTSADVDNVGTSSNVLLDFLIPRGANGTPGAAGSPGATGATGPMNQTPNMTAGPAGTPGTMNLTFNLTPNMTANMTASNLDLSWNASYWLSDASRPITSEKVKRNVDNDLLTLYGGNSIAGGYGGLLSLYGKDHATPDAVYVTVGDGAVGNKPVTIWYAGAVSYMHMTNKTIEHLVTGINGGSSVNKSYVDAAIAAIPPGGSGGDVSQYLFLNGTRQMTGLLNASSAGVNVAGGNVSNVKRITVATDAANKSYVDNAIAAIPPGGSGGDVSQYLFLNGTRPMSGIFNASTINMSWKSIKNVVSNDDGGDAVNKTYVDTWRSTNRTRPVVIESDFYSGSTGAVPGLLGVAISSGTVASVATTSAHPGVIYLRDSTTANGGYRYGCDGTVLIAGNEYYETIFQTVGTRTTQHARMGWSDSTAGATMPTDGVYFNVSSATGAMRLSGVSASNNVRTATVSTYAPTASTWYRGEIYVNPTGTIATFNLYSDAGALLWVDSVASNIPTGAGRDTSQCIIAAETTTDAAADILRMDYTRWDVNRTLTRG